MKLLQFPSPRPRQRPSIAERNELVEKHLDLVPPVARSMARFLPSAFELDDLIQEGTLGLIKAAEMYSPERGPFPPWAHVKIRGFILDSVRRKNWTFAKGAEPIEAAANVIDPSQDIDRMLEEQSAEQLAARAFEPLDDREKTVVVEIYRSERTRQQIGRRMRISSSSVTRIHRSAITKISDHMKLAGIAA